MIAGHYEYQTGRPGGLPSGGIPNDLLILILFSLAVGICFTIYESRQAQARENADIVEEPAPNNDVDDNEHNDVDGVHDDDDDDDETTSDPDLIIVPNDDGYATGIDDDDNVGQPRERLPERGASPRRG